MGYERLYILKTDLCVSRKETSSLTAQYKMGRFYIRFFEQGVEVDWFRLDDGTLDYILENVIDMCGPTYHTKAYFDTYDDGDDMCLSYYMNDKQTPIPKDVLAKTIEFGWGKDRKELQLIGDRIPIDADYKFQITYS